MFKTKIIQGLENFRKHVEQWNELWLASGSRVGLHRALPLIHFVEAFAKPDEFRAVVATQNDQWITGIPLLVQRNRFGRINARSLSNEWAVQDCILDRATGSIERFHALQSGLRELGCSAIKFPWCPLDWPSSQALIDGWKTRGNQISIRSNCVGAQLNLAGDWPSFWAGLSKNRRKKLQKGLSELSKLGPVELDSFASNDLNLAKSYLDVALRIELNSWKGESRTAVMNDPRVTDYFRKNAMDFSKCGILRIYLLKVAGKAIAFDMGYIANGVYTSHKVSYIKEFADFSPGQLLTIKLIERLYESNEAHSIDFLGPISSASEPWANAQYPIGKLTLSGGTVISDLSVFTLGKIAEFVRPGSLQTNM